MVRHLNSTGWRLGVESRGGMAKAIVIEQSGVVNPRATLAAALLSFSLITLDMFMVNVALPHIREDLDSGVGGMLWVINGYTIMFAALMLPAGVLADRLGASRAFKYGLIGFLGAAMVCFMAPTIGVLIAGRFLLGSSAAMMLPSSMAMLRDAYPQPKERARAIAIWAMGGAGASASGPLFAGLILESGWRMIFMLYLPISVVILWLLRSAPASRPTLSAFHLPSQIVVCIGMLGFIFGLIRGGINGFTDPLPLIAFVVAIVAFALFTRMQSTVHTPLIPHEILRSRSALASIAVGMAFVISFYGLIFLLSLYLQDVRGRSALETGVVFLPMAVLSIGVNAIAARAAERFGLRRVIVIGMVLVMIGLAFVAIFAPSVSTYQLAIVAMPLGLGGALAMPVATAWLVNSVPDDLVGTASGLLNTCRQACAAMSIAIFGVLVTQSRSFEFGMRISLMIGITALIGAVLAVVWSREGRQSSLR